MTQLLKLLELPVKGRLAAVAEDLDRKRRRFAAIRPHDLAEALGVPSPWQPDGDWHFISYAPILSVEEYVSFNDPASEVVYFLKDCVSPARFAELLRHSEPLDRTPRPTYSFLTKTERRLLERAIARDTLESNMSNGMNCIARYHLQVRGRRPLTFEGVVEDDGSCIELRTPYDERKGKFVDLSNCVVEEY